MGMLMFKSYGHIKKPKKITIFLMILVWVWAFNVQTAQIIPC